MQDPPWGMQDVCLVGVPAPSITGAAGLNPAAGTAPQKEDVSVRSRTLLSPAAGSHGGDLCGAALGPGMSNGPENLVFVVQAVRKRREGGWHRSHETRGTPSSQESEL